MRKKSFLNFRKNRVRFSEEMLYSSVDYESGVRIHASQIHSDVKCPQNRHHRGRVQIRRPPAYGAAAYGTVRRQSSDRAERSGNPDEGGPDPAAPGQWHRGAGAEAQV